MGFALGAGSVWGGCGHFQMPDSQGLVVCALGGVLFGILGWLIGSTRDRAHRGR